MAAIQVSSSLTDHVSGDSVTVTTENSFSSAKTIKIENLNVRWSLKKEVLVSMLVFFLQ